MIDRTSAVAQRNVARCRGADMGAPVDAHFVNIAPRLHSIKRRCERPMSTTIPLTLIEGATAMPRLRPLDHLPAPFGRDWALLPPHASVRTELKALYAAILRTFCLNAAAILSVCRWDPRRTPVAAVSRDRPETQDTPARVHAEIAVDANIARHGSAYRWTALAGGACALGGAAVLAWLASHHLSQHRGTHYATQQGPVVGRGRGASARDTRTPSPIPLAPNRNGAARLAGPTVDPTDTAESTRTSATRRLLMTDAGNLDHTLRSQVSTARRKPRNVVPESARVKQQQEPSVTASSNAAPRQATGEVRARRWAKPSAAGGFSPVVPAALGIDEYASITMSAGTHLRDIAQPRSAPHRAAVGTDNSEWLKHLTHRRVTEVPEQFAE
jgi:hypothetical protein